MGYDKSNHFASFITARGGRHTQDQDNDQSNSVTDVKQLGLWASIASLSYVFWICGGMEMVERLAYYGARMVSGLYATDAASNGGVGMTETELGTIFLVWAVIQTWTPVFTGGLSDRYGYKETIFFSTVFKILGYLLMAMLPTYWGFMAGAATVAFGTGIFKPGIQGTIVKATSRKNSSMAWGIFYQTVNIGGWIGPLIAVRLQVLAWDQVFYACAGIISLNFLLLLTYKEPDKQARLERLAQAKDEKPLWRESLDELKNPVLIWYIVLFSGFWAMLMFFWDIAPLYFRDWVDTVPLVTAWFGADGTSNETAIFLLGMSEDGKVITPVGLVSFNSMLIMTCCFIVAGLSGRLKAANSMAIGTFLASSAFIIMGSLNAAWIIVLAIFCFSIGEMLSSPKSSEFMGNIAPPDKKAMYLGFSQMPIGIGWTAESFFGPYLYGKWSSKEQISREVLSEHGLSISDIDAIPVGEAFDHLVMVSGESARVITEQLYMTHNVGGIWYLMAAIGIISALGMYQYGRWMYRIAIVDA
ncbi:MFS transporter [Pseudemcibacter aquimaris]|uniref:MFS transporter n=1 Tax=Pseudemcibacter aquimaris TaxID=2857064 RepID=UPI0020116331|nr:MFS transporter [Pseudemcibacter aquimaris]MCC3859909.1 MFS transporter [Pseudemcibacter aquimaris]